MSRRSVVLLIAGLAAVVGCATGPTLRPVRPIDFGKRMLVVVDDVRNETGNPEYDSLMDGLAGKITAELQETDCFRMIERQKLKSILEEMKLGTTGMAVRSGSAEAGHLAGAEAILFVSLASVKYDESRNSTFFAKDVKEEFETVMDARLVAVETGEILAAAKISIPATNRYRSFCLFKDGEKADRNLVVKKSLDKANKYLAREIAWQVSKRVR